MFPEARLDVALRVRDGIVADVAVRSTRLVQASRLFAGRRPDEVLTLLPTIFALCGTAQVLAGLSATEQASGLPPSAAQLPARQMLLLAETVAEHGLTLARDWPAHVGAEPDLAAARRIKTAMASIRPALFPAGDWNHPGGGTVAPQHPAIAVAIAAARAALTSLLDADIAAIVAGPDQFRAWVNTSRCAAARLIAEASDDALAGFGRGPFLPMPEQGPADLSARLEGERDGDYLARPDSAGRVFETGPLARQAWHPVVAALIGAHGPGLLARLAARLVEVASSLQEMDELVQSLDADHAPLACLVDGSGLGLVEAARGLLAHRVELEGGRVKRYQILAPTEWNFHPDGPLARGLRGMPATADLQRRAALLVGALDPCVACSVTVE
ncbi:MAG TPA: nickel-dependent hydrogenase large subunit [Magnetospirillum sp.]|nr:nickel-dependent hydrogenase large subunit [Magnetospirillum sp.]